MAFHHERKHSCTKGAILLTTYQKWRGKPSLESLKQETTQNLDKQVGSERGLTIDFIGIKNN